MTCKRGRRMTNFEKIKNMSIGEMAKLINKIVAYCINDEECVDCLSIIGEWLNSEAEE